MVHHMHRIQAYTDDICLQDQVTGLSCSAFSESMLQTSLLHADAWRVLQAPNPLPCVATNRDFRGLMRLIIYMTIGRHGRRYRQSAAPVVPTCHLTSRHLVS